MGVPVPHRARCLGPISHGFFAAPLPLLLLRLTLTLPHCTCCCCCYRQVRGTFWGLISGGVAAALSGADTSDGLLFYGKVFGGQEVIT